MRDNWLAAVPPERREAAKAEWEVICVNASRSLEKYEANMTSIMGQPYSADGASYRNGYEQGWAGCYIHHFEEFLELSADGEEMAAKGEEFMDSARRYSKAAAWVFTLFILAGCCLHFAIAGLFYLF